MPIPETRYAKSGDVHIAYQVVGDGPFDMVFVPGFVSNVEAVWSSPPRARFLQGLASFCRLILFDKRGTGMSDRTSQIFTLEQRANASAAYLRASASPGAAVAVMQMNREIDVRDILPSVRVPTLVMHRKLAQSG